MPTAARIRRSVAERGSTVSITEYSVRRMVILINGFTYVHMENLKLDLVKELQLHASFLRLCRRWSRS